jgi:hypothetical protein
LGVPKNLNTKNAKNTKNHEEIILDFWDGLTEGILAHMERRGWVQKGFGRRKECVKVEGGGGVNLT